jgi:hypothetical protein
MMLANFSVWWRSIVGMTLVVVGTISIPAIATAPQAPQLVVSKLNGKPIDVLYVTRSSDRVLVRCYPGLKPKIVVRPMSGGTQEGVLTCINN